MTDWIDYCFFTFLGAALLLSILGVWFAVVIPTDRRNKRFFLSYFIVLMVCCFSSILEMVLTVYPGPVWAIRLVQILESLFLSLPLPMLTVYLLHSCGDSIRGSRLAHVVFALWLIFFVLTISVSFVEGFFCNTTGSGYSRGPLYPLLVLPLVIIQLINIVGVIRRRPRLSPKVFRSFLIALVPMTAALIGLMFADVFALLDIAIVVSALSMFGLIVSDQIEQDQRQQREIANQRANIMVLQMRPHFIYNTMMSIYGLCRQDPEKARQVIMDFTTYLRNNFTAVASATPIPFSSELEHTRAYLAVEQAQYEDSLFVEYDTPHTLFRVPPLTLQPIVENAVKHGRDPYGGAFHISIQTRKTDSGSEIIVTDDGCGFDPAEGSEPGIALKNIQQRLISMCGGKLEIRQRETGGTQVTIFVPGQER